MDVYAAMNPGRKISNVFCVCVCVYTVTDIHTSKFVVTSLKSSLPTCPTFWKQDTEELVCLPQTASPTSLSFQLFFFFFSQCSSYFLMRTVCVCIGSAISSTGCVKPTFFFFFTAAGKVLNCLICSKTAEFSS